MTRKQIDEVEKNVVIAETKFERNKDKLEWINKVLVDAKAGIEHLCEKLSDIMVDGKHNFRFQGTNLDDALSQCETTIRKILEEMDDDKELYDQIIEKIRSLRPGKGPTETLAQKEKEGLPDLEPPSSNIRIRLPDKEDDEISDWDPDEDAEHEISERMKIKVEA